MCNGPAQLHLRHGSTSPSRASTRLWHHHRLQQAASDQPQLLAEALWSPLTALTPWPRPPQATSAAQWEVSRGIDEYGAPGEIYQFLSAWGPASCQKTRTVCRIMFTGTAVLHPSPLLTHHQPGAQGMEAAPSTRGSKRQQPPRWRREGQLVLGFTWAIFRSRMTNPGNRQSILIGLARIGLYRVTGCMGTLPGPSRWGRIRKYLL